MEEWLRGVSDVFADVADRLTTASIIIEPFPPLRRVRSILTTMCRYSLEDTSTQGIRQLRDDTPVDPSAWSAMPRCRTYETKNIDTPSDPKLSKIGLAGNLLSVSTSASEIF